MTQALRERLARLRRERSKRRLADELEAIAEHCASLLCLTRGLPTNSGIRRSRDASLMVIDTSALLAVDHPKQSSRARKLIDAGGIYVGGQMMRVQEV